MSFVTNVPSTSGGVNSGFVPGVSGSNFVSSAGSYLLNRYGPTIVGAAQYRMDTAVKSVVNTIAGNSQTSTNSPGSGSGSSSNGNTGGGGNPPGARGGRRPASRLGPGGVVNRQGIPQFSIDSGIESGTITNPLQRTTEYYSPMYVQCGSLFPMAKDSDLSSLMNNELFFKYSVIVRSEVNYSLSRQFTIESFFQYINVLSHSLQLYYMVDSILAYTCHTPNNNIAMTRLSMAISPEIANGHIKLKEMLESVPIPPKLLEYIRYMYQNYSFNNVSGSSIIRLSLGDSLCTSEYSGSLGIDGSTYVNILNNLIECMDVSSIIRKIRANWVTTMLPSSYESLFDPQFSTFWHNSNISYEDYGSKDIKFTINAKSESDLLYYGIFDNRLDGLIYSSCSVLDQNNVMQKGLWSPFNNFASKKSINSSLLHYSNDNIMRPITEVAFRNASMVFAAPHTEITPDKNPVWKVIKSNYAGSCVPQVHTLENVTQALVRSVNWLLNP